MLKKSTVSIRQKNFIDNKKRLGFKRIQVYISLDSYNQLSSMRADDLTFSNIIEDSINQSFKKWSKSNIKKGKYDF